MTRTQTVIPQPHAQAGVTQALAQPRSEATSGQPSAWTPAWESVRDRWEFVKGFVHHPDQVASVVASSARLEAQLVRTCQLSGARCVVELGPGTGGTTRALLRGLDAQARLLAIELCPEFLERIGERIHDPRLVAQHGSAEQIADFLAAWDLPPPDAVVSGIPFSTLPSATGERIAATIASVLAPGGRFVAYQLRAHVARAAAPYLGVPRCQWQWLNVPPLRVFSWSKAC
jgi:phospholipid N-methyltransferase